MSEPSICPLSGEECRCSARMRTSCERDLERSQERVREYERRGNPQRFTLSGMVYHPSPDRPGDGSWTLPAIDPSPEQNEVIAVREDRITGPDLDALDGILRNGFGERLSAERRRALALELAGALLSPRREEAR